MPELPEVETIARALRQGGRGGAPILGQVICEARLLWERTLAEPDPQTFLQRLPGQEVVDIGRRGKFLVINLSADSLLIHLRMSGDLRVEPAYDSAGQPVPDQPHDRMVIHFDGSPESRLRLAFNDTRKFGRVWLVPTPEIVLGQLGPEPFDADFTEEEFFRRLQRVNRQIKPLLLDQRFVAGLGNIYADEALHAAGIHPLRSSASLSVEEAARLWAAIREALSEGIRRNGASFDWVYRGGEFQNYFRVYQREGQPCPRCGTSIVKITVGQRGTHFCPVCQTTDF